MKSVSQTWNASESYFGIEIEIESRESMKSTQLVRERDATRYKLSTSAPAAAVTATAPTGTSQPANKLISSWISCSDSRTLQLVLYCGIVSWCCINCQFSSVWIAFTPIWIVIEVLWRSRFRFIWTLSFSFLSLVADSSIRNVISSSNVSSQQCVRTNSSIPRESVLHRSQQHHHQTRWIGK